MALAASSAQAAVAPGTARLTWPAVDHPGLGGYVVRWGTRSGEYSHTADVGLATSAVIPDLPAGEPLYSVVSAYSVTGMRSAPSEEIAFVWSPPPPSTDPGDGGDDGEVGNGGGDDSSDPEPQPPGGGSSKGTARFQWPAVDHPSVAGYRVHWGNSSGNYTHSVDVGPTTEAVLSEFEADVQYFAAITAYTTTGESSPYSAELSFKYLAGSGGEIPVFRIASLSPQGGGAVRFEVSGGSGSEIRIFASGDLEHWEQISSEPFASGEFTIIDPGADGATRRFYRLEVH